MFNNIGGKIKGLAKFFCWAGIIACVITGIILFAQAGEAYSGVRPTLILSGLAIMIIGSLLSWIGSFLLYGFGELVESISNIRHEVSELSAIVKRTKPSVEVHYQSSDSNKTLSQKQTLADFDV